MTLTRREVASGFDTPSHLSFPLIVSFQMFPLHPLTVEDVLQQDPREKVDVFDTLGYYFVVFRAIDERYFRYTSASASTLGLGVNSRVESSGTDADSSPVMKEKFISPSSSLHQGGLPFEAARGEKRGLPTLREESFEMKEMSSDSSQRTKAGEKHEDGKLDQDWKGEKDESGSPNFSRRRHGGKARVDIIEGVDGKEGIEGVSVGAVNLYLIVFAHGVISVSSFS